MPSAKQNRIKRQKKYAQNKEAANLYMMEYREKKKDIVQLSNKEYVTVPVKRVLVAHLLKIELLLP